MAASIATVTLSIFSLCLELRGRYVANLSPGVLQALLVLIQVKVFSIGARYTMVYLRGFTSLVISLFMYIIWFNKPSQLV